MRRFISISSKFFQFSFRFCSKNKPNQFHFEKGSTIQPEISKEEIDAIKDVFYKDGRMDVEVEKELEIKPEEVFQEREQLISFNLLQCSDVNSIFKLYLDELEKQQNEKQPKFTSNELSLFVYFISNARTHLNFSKHINKYLSHYNTIINECIEQINQLLPQQTNAFIWALGIFNFETNQLLLTETQKSLILTKLESDLQQIPLENLPSLAFSLRNIFGYTCSQSSQIILSIVTIATKNLSNYTSTSLLSLVHALPSKCIDQSFELFKHLEMRFLDDDAFSADEFVTTIIELHRVLDGENQDKLDEFLKLLSEGMSTRGVTIISPQYAIQLLGTVPHHEIASQLLSSVNSSIQKLDTTDFVNLYLTLPILKVKFEKTVEQLKIITDSSTMFKFSDFTIEDRVNVLVAIAALRIDHREYVMKWVNSVEKEIKSLKKSDLLKLALSYVIYVRQFENFYIQIHEACVDNIKMFSQIEMQKLRKVFNRVKTLFPDSPFFK